MATQKSGLFPTNHPGSEHACVLGEGFRRPSKLGRLEGTFGPVKKGRADPRVKQLGCIVEALQTQPPRGGCLFALWPGHCLRPLA